MIEQIVYVDPKPKPDEPPPTTNPEIEPTLPPETEIPNIV